jgi:hypothetical protein
MVLDDLHLCTFIPGNLMDKTLLQNRDYTLIIAKTTLDETHKPPGFAERWNAAQGAIVSLAQACEAHDPDGITLYVSCLAPQESCQFKKYDHVTSAHLTQLIQENMPPRQINLREVLELALEDYFARKTAGTTKPNGEIMIILLDGEPSDRMAVAKAIKDATQKMEVNEELGIGFVQIGEDLLAKGFLTALDDHLQSVGAKFDIVHTKLLDTISPDSLTDFLMDTLFD